MPNTINYAAVFQQELDKAFVHEACTAWMDENAGLVKYEGGAEIKIPVMALSGLADYDRSTGYVEGDVSLTYETKTMTQDRGRGFTLDAMDVDETNFAATAGMVMGEFQRMHVVPEVDAYRIAKLYENTPAGNRKTGALTASNVYGLLVDDIAAVRDIVGPGMQLMVHLGYAAKALLAKSTEFNRNVDSANFKHGELTTKVRSLDGDLLLDTPSACLKTGFTFYKGVADDSVNDKKAGGFAPAAEAKSIHWLIVPRKAPIAVCKQDKVRTFDPSTYQKANAWHVDYRKYHDLWVLDNQAKALYARTEA